MWYRPKLGHFICWRNWHWDEPSCGREMCAVLYYQPSAPPDEEGHFLFQWNDDNCNSKNNFVCKYPEGEAVNQRLCAVVSRYSVLGIIDIWHSWFDLILESTKSEFYPSKSISKVWPHCCQQLAQGSKRANIKSDLSPNSKKKTGVLLHLVAKVKTRH